MPGNGDASRNWKGADNTDYTSPIHPPFRNRENTAGNINKGTE